MVDFLRGNFAWQIMANLQTAKFKLLNGLYPLRPVVVQPRSTLSAIIPGLQMLDLASKYYLVNLQLAKRIRGTVLSNLNRILVYRYNKDSICTSIKLLKLEWNDLHHTHLPAIPVLLIPSFVILRVHLLTDTLPGL